MLLSKIYEEFEELTKIIVNKELFESYKRIFEGKNGHEKDVLLAWSIEMRQISRIDVVLENKKFESKIVQEYVNMYIKCIKNIFDRYDSTIKVLSLAGEKEIEQGFRNSIIELRTQITNLEDMASKISEMHAFVSKLMKETWEPLPDDKKEDDVNNIVVSSKTRSMSLNNIASDVDHLDRFLNNICLLIGKDESNNIYLRKVETGSLTVAVSCTMGIAQIIAFMFWCIKLCQNTAKRSLNNEEKNLNNKEKKLKIINDEINIAKEILKIQPDNKAADEIIQGCAIHLLDFLENNPTGTINGEYYDIGMEKPKIEDKEKIND